MAKKTKSRAKKASRKAAADESGLRNEIESVRKHLVDEVRGGFDTISGAVNRGVRSVAAAVNETTSSLSRTLSQAEVRQHVRKTVAEIEAVGDGIYKTVAEQLTALKKRAESTAPEPATGPAARKKTAKKTAGKKAARKKASKKKTARAKKAATRKTTARKTDARKTTGKKRAVRKPAGRKKVTTGTTRKNTRTR